MVIVHLSSHKMLRYFKLLICLIATIFAFSEENEQVEELLLSTPEQLATLTSEPSYLIGNIINPLSGQPALKRTDLIAKGAQDVILTRTYVPPFLPCRFPEHKKDKDAWQKFQLYTHLQKNYRGWEIFPHLKLQYLLHRKVIRMTEPNGSTFDFYIGPDHKECALVSPLFALTNTVGEQPSGKHDISNTRISFQDRGNAILIHAPDGTTRYYNRFRKVYPIHSYYLNKEVLPNGKVLRYHYGLQGLSLVESKDPHERYTYASINLSDSTQDANKRKFTTSSGQIAEYQYETRHFDKVKVKEKNEKGSSKQRIEGLYPATLANVSSPYYREEKLEYCPRLLLGSYYGKDDIFKCYNVGYGHNPLHFRVHQLILPVGDTDDFIPVYNLNYNPPIAGKKEGSTTVHNSDGTSTHYHFSKDLLTTSIKYFGQDGALKKEKIFSWDEKKHWLNFIELRDGLKRLFYRKSFAYDKFGNPKLEIFTGDLAGDGNE